MKISYLDFLIMTSFQNWVIAPGAIIKTNTAREQLFSDVFSIILTGLSNDQS